MRTPWGNSDSIATLPNGIRRVDTPSHGGYWLPMKLARSMRAEFQMYALKWSGSIQWYEEDVAWSCVAVSFPEYFSIEDVAGARETVARWVVA